MCSDIEFIVCFRCVGLLLAIFVFLYLIIGRRQFTKWVTFDLCSRLLLLCCKHSRNQQVKVHLNTNQTACVMCNWGKTKDTNTACTKKFLLSFWTANQKKNANKIKSNCLFNWRCQQGGSKIFFIFCTDCVTFLFSMHSIGLCPAVYCYGTTCRQTQGKSCNFEIKAPQIWVFYSWDFGQHQHMLLNSRTPPTEHFRQLIGAKLLTAPMSPLQFLRDIEDELYMTQLEESALRRRIQESTGVGVGVGSLTNGNGVHSDLQHQLEQIERDKRELGQCHWFLTPKNAIYCLDCENCKVF